MANIELTPIGVFHSSQVEPYEAGRQPDAFHSQGYIELNKGSNFEQAVIGLEGCERIWVLFRFHHNPHWNPMVLPPRGIDTKIGVFATRSPYRPNGIGMSCVQILKIEDHLKIHVTGADILDQSPILDIKPYIAYADSFPGVEPLWLQGASRYEVHFSEQALEQIDWLESQGLSQIRGFLIHQLEYEPSNSKKKRVKKLNPKEPSQYLIAYRTWRALFSITDKNIEIEKIFSGYTETDLNSNEDPYKDKKTHRSFKRLFPTG